MKITAAPAHLLTPEHIRRWGDLQASDSWLSSPFLSPEYSMAVAAVRGDVEVGIMECGGTPVGFFPFQRGRWARGRPVGLFLNDMQAVVAVQGLDWDSVALLRGCRLVELEFTRLLASQVPFTPFHYQRRQYAAIDLACGFQAYVAQKRSIGSRVIRNAEARARKLERDVGPLRFEADSRQAAPLTALMKWKLERYRAHGYVDIFAIPWVRAVLDQIHATQTGRFSGMLSSLYAGDELVAAHLGMRCLDVWHYWYHAYNPRFAQYSPGLTLMLRVAERAADLGVKRLELGGCDEYGYKQQFMNTSSAVIEGSVSAVRAITVARRWRHQAANTIRQSIYLRPPARRVLRAYRRLRHRFLYDHVEYEAQQDGRPIAQD